MLQNRNRFLCPVQHPFQGGVIYRVANAQINTADQAFVGAGIQLQLFFRRFYSGGLQSFQARLAHPFQLRFGKWFCTADLHRQAAAFQEGRAFPARNVQLFLRAAHQFFGHALACFFVVRTGQNLCRP